MYQSVSPYDRRQTIQFWGQTNQDWRFPPNQGYHAGLPHFRAIEQQNWMQWAPHETVPYTIQGKWLTPDVIGSWRQPINSYGRNLGTPVPLTQYQRAIRTPYPATPTQQSGVARSRYGGIIVYGNR